MFFRPRFLHRFLGALFMDFGGFGRSRGPPKSTRTLQKYRFYLGASTILKKDFCFHDKTDIQNKHVFLSLLDLQKPLQITLRAKVLIDLVLLCSENVPGNHHVLKSEVPGLKNGPQGSTNDTKNIKSVP